MKPALRVVPKAELSPAETLRQRVRKASKPAAMLQCRRCQGREVIQARSGVTITDGKPAGGTKVLICALCLARGERVVLA